MFNRKYGNFSEAELLRRQQEAVRQAREMHDQTFRKTRSSKIADIGLDPEQDGTPYDRPVSEFANNYADSKVKNQRGGTGRTYAGNYAAEAPARRSAKRASSRRFYQSQDRRPQEPASHRQEFRPKPSGFQKNDVSSEGVFLNYTPEDRAAEPYDTPPIQNFYSQNAYKSAENPGVRQPAQHGSRGAPDTRNAYEPRSASETREAHETRKKPGGLGGLFAELFGTRPNQGGSAGGGLRGFLGNLKSDDILLLLLIYLLYTEKGDPDILLILGFLFLSGL